ncbi:MAG: histidine kinase [Bacteroidia bacterium]|nr:histidine kinase [Bacteroidia bacterium]
MFRKSKSFFPSLYFLIAGLLVSIVNIYSQNFTIKSYTTADGLPHNNVRAIARDSSGFLWLGTWDGLSRFDGHSFRNYFHEPDDSTSIPFFSISELLVDGVNNLWIFTDTRELVKYNRGTDDFQTMKAIDGLHIGYVNNISTDQSGNLLITGLSSIIKMDPVKKELTVLKLTGKDNKPYIIKDPKTWLTMAGDSVIWMAGTLVSEFRKSEINEYHLFREYQVEKTINVPKTYFESLIWRSFYLSLCGNKWLFSNNGLFKLNEASGIFREYTETIPENEFTGRDYFYWGKRNDGIYFYNQANKKLTYIPDHQAKWPTAILPDRKYSFWFSNSTSGGVTLGVSRVAFIPGSFKNTLITSSDSTSPAVYSVIMDRERKIWTGIRSYDHILQFGAGNSVSGTDFISQKIIDSAAYIRSMIPVNDGIWIGYLMNLLQFYDYSTGIFVKHHAEARSFRAIAVNSEGNVYIGTNNLSIYNPGTGKTEILWKSPEANGIFKLYADTSGIIWGGMSESKLLKYNTLTREGSEIKIASGICNVEDIIQGEDGDLWLALLGKGVCRYNTVTGATRYYTTSKGLSNNTTYSLLKDKSGHIWVSTNDGISMIHPESENVRAFDETDGIAISEFNSGAKFIADDGEFFFGGMGGFIRFYPDSIQLSEETTQNKLLLTHLEVSGETRNLPQGLNETDTIILAKGENNFHLSFSSTDFINADRTNYRYKLSGVNKKWIETGSQNRNINYSNLRPDWYDLIIEAADQNGDWTASRDIVIRIKPAFYQTRIFRILMPLLVLMIVVFSVIVYTEQLKQRERSKQYELKLQSLRSQMNPHFIFNSLNSINYFISNNDKLSANRYIADFSRLIRSILSNMGSDFIPLENEIRSLKDYLRIEHLRFGDKFEYNLETSEIDNMNDTEICPGIVQPFIENAIWHGVRPLEKRKGMINIKFVRTDNEGLRCIIEDDGIGRTASMKSRETDGSHKPKGINIITERLQITGKLRRTNYKFEITDLNTDRKDTGTRVEVDIPVKINKHNQHDKSSSS